MIITDNTCATMRPHSSGGTYHMMKIIILSGSECCRLGVLRFVCFDRASGAASSRPRQPVSQQRHQASHRRDDDDRRWLLWLAKTPSVAVVGSRNKDVVRIGCCRRRRLVCLCVVPTELTGCRRELHSSQRSLDTDYDCLHRHRCRQWVAAFLFWLPTNGQTSR